MGDNEQYSKEVLISRLYLSLSLVTRECFHTLLHPPTFEKDLGSLNQNLYLSPFLSLPFSCLWNFINSIFSLTLDDLLLGSGSSLDCNCGNP